MALICFFGSHGESHIYCPCDCIVFTALPTNFSLPCTNFPEMNCRVNFDYSPALVSVAKKRTRAVRNRASLIHLRS